jgi:hypothetical protein
MLYQFPRNSKHISRCPCTDVPIFLEEFDECDFLFRIQIISHESDLRGFILEKWNGLVELSLQLDGHHGGLELRHDRVWGDSAKAFFRSWSSMNANSVLTVLQLSQSQT